VSTDPVCEDFNVEMKACFGDQFEPIECDQISRTDLENLTKAARDLDCRENGWALPIDGDYLSASCRLTGVGCVGAVNELPAFAPTQHPILLVNGIDVSLLFQWSDRIQRTMRDLGGHDVHLALDAPYETPQRRAHDLWAKIRDVRISTAHRGTPIADAALGYLAEGDALDAAERLATTFGDAFTPDQIEQDVRLRAAIQALSTPAAAAFNAEIIDSPDVHYQSWAGFSAPYGVPPLGHDEALAELCPDFGAFRGNHDHMATPLIPSAEMIDGPSDGLAPVSSAPWGEMRGCIPADHMEQLGQYRIPEVNVRTGFDIARFYAAVAADLSGRGY
jgi:hypothetical protein